MLDLRKRLVHQLRKFPADPPRGEIAALQSVLGSRFEPRVSGVRSQKGKNPTGSRRELTRKVAFQQVDSLFAEDSELL